MGFERVKSAVYVWYGIIVRSDAIQMLLDTPEKWAFDVCLLLVIMMSYSEFNIQVNDYLNLSIVASNV